MRAFGPCRTATDVVWFRQLSRSLGCNVNISSAHSVLLLLCLWTTPFLEVSVSTCPGFGWLATAQQGLWCVSKACPACHLALLQKALDTDEGGKQTHWLSRCCSWWIPLTTSLTHPDRGAGSSVFIMAAVKWSWQPSVYNVFKIFRVSPTNSDKSLGQSYT